MPVTIATRMNHKHTLSLSLSHLGGEGGAELLVVINDDPQTNQHILLVLNLHYIITNYIITTSL